MTRLRQGSGGQARDGKGSSEARPVCECAHVHRARLTPQLLCDGSGPDCPHKAELVDSQPRATISDMQAWAQGVMTREPDFIIGDNYLRRWWVIPRNDFCNIYLHEILRSDDDRALHDHPWANSSWVIDGGYIEHVPNGPSLHRTAGDFVTREATALHRLELPEGGRAVSLFITGPKVREWGFACPQGWRHWKDFVGEHPGQVGRGCGE